MKMMRVQTTGSIDSGRNGRFPAPLVNASRLKQFHRLLVKWGEFLLALGGGQYRSIYLSHYIF